MAMSVKRRLRSLIWRLPESWRARLRVVPGVERLRGLLAGRPVHLGPLSGEKRAVVYLPTWLQWDTMRQRPQYLLAAFAAAGHPVFFVDPREPRPRRVSGVEIVPGLEHVPISGAILYVHFAPIRTLFDRFVHPAVVYDLLDDLTIFDADEVGYPEERRVRTHHPFVMAAADVVIVSNSVLAERHRAEREDLLLVQNGVDPTMFGTPAPRPSDLPDPDPARSIIGYHGAIAYWFDFDLITAVARRAPDWRFVLVGPVDERVRHEADLLATLPNVDLLGERPSDAMPGYVQGFDVGAIWFQLTEMTQGVTPLKMYEYLAAGVACVSTPLPACVEEPAVATAADSETFVARLGEALATSGDLDVMAKRRAAAEAHSWQARLEPALERLKALGLDRVS
jgi:glycosyltransferase involved in cell wall biosynthesis